LDAVAGAHRGVAVELKEALQPGQLGRLGGQLAEVAARFQRRVGVEAAQQDLLLGIGLEGRGRHLEGGFDRQVNAGAFVVEEKEELVFEALDENLTRGAF